MSNSLVVRKNSGNSLTILKSGSLSAIASLPPATNATLGGIIVGDNLSITGNGVLSVADTFQPKTSCVTYGLTDTLLPSGPNTFYVSGEHVVQSGRNSYTGLRGRKTSAGYQNATFYGVGSYNVDSNGTPTRLSTLETSSSGVLLSVSDLTTLSVASTVAMSAGDLQLATSNGSLAGSSSLVLENGMVKIRAFSSGFVQLAGNNNPPGSSENDYTFSIASGSSLNDGVSIQKRTQTTSLEFPYIISNATARFSFDGGLFFFGGDPLSAATELQHRYTNTFSNTTSSTKIRLVRNNAELSFAEMIQVKTTNSILTQGYADTRYPLLNSSTGHRILSQQNSQEKYAQLDFGIPNGTVAFSATDAVSLRVMPYNGTVADQSFLAIGVTKTNAIIESGNRTWTDDSILTRNYADTRYLASANLTYANLTGTPTTLAGYGITDGLTSSSANSTYAVLGHTHAISEITGLQTALDAKLPSANFTYANLTGTPNLTLYLTTANASSTYQPLGNYATTSCLTFANLTGKPTTLSGYGITDGYSTSNPSGYITAGANSFTGTQNLQDNELIRAKIRDYSETVSSPTISAGTLVLNLETSNIFTVSLNAAITTLTISNPPASGSGGSFTLIFTADGTARAVTWPASIKWAGGTAPTITSTSGKVDSFAFFTSDGGTNWQGYVGGQNF
jgi:hypothetical protein